MIKATERKLNHLQNLLQHKNPNKYNDGHDKVSVFSNAQSTFLSQ
jgi:hypothetical protein